MKIVKPIITAAALLLLVFSGCAGNVETGSPDDFVVDLRRISLNASELGTLPGRPPEPLHLSKFPDFATRAEVVWTSSNESVATINSETGAITVRTAPVTEPLTTTIRVAAVHDPSIYALCSLTVYPDYPARRRWNFTADLGTISGDIDIGQGATLLQATGGGSYTSSGAGEYIIDPEAPYAEGFSPNGGARSGMAWNNGSLTDPAFYRAPADYFGTHAAEGAASAGHLRTGGTARFMRIAALQGPFTIKVNYLSNGTAGAHADIRVGDREGIRIEGEGSAGSTAGSGKCVEYVYEGDDFVPLVYLECDTGLRVYDVYVLSEAANTFKHVPDTFDITGSATIDAGNTAAYAVNISATDPVYAWVVESGLGQIVGSSSGSSVNLKATGVGSITLKVTVTTTNPDLPTDVKTVSQTKTISAVYAPITAVAIGGPGTVEEDKTITLTTVLTPSYVLSPTYLWEITDGDGTFGEITDGTTNPTAVLKGIEQPGSVTVKVTVTTTDPTTSFPASVSTTKTITVIEELQAGQAIHWKFQTVPTGWIDDGSNNNNTTVLYENGMTLLGASRTTRILTTRPGTAPASMGAIQPNGAGKWAKIENLPAQFTVQAYYTDTGGDATGRKPSLYINGGANVLFGADDPPGGNGSAVLTFTYTYTGAAGNVYIELEGQLRWFDVIITPF